ncbi:tripartite tricarboxylate transporter substrate binding protein [Pusillimonas sp. MFBS29]|uniref:Bug family tripartite tricarboxylate transporter substrate binding protein n=1 Tax=Pusillimonas sp. MFBS29 TaxID=2886690 RepID=UPI001D1239AA|nr:tripartite tricarboxylate transporter substrate binding protein [Pusillimonas sp. MFBS29]MCC2596848.1 tripartite tricarboxylate transporter substrate binding protein [Pusillimonas sp. MFBS29]
MKRTLNPRAWLGGVAAMLALHGSCAAATADISDYPNQPIRMVVPFSPGGITDLLGRLVADELSQLYEQPVVVENRPGASGHVGANLAAKAEPDGYTLLLGTIGIHAAYSIYSKLAYNPSTDLQPAMVLGASPNIVLVPASSRFKTFGELLDYEKKHPGKLNYATAGPGSSVHMVTALYEQMIDTKLTYVPYKGSGPALIDIIGERVDVMFDNLPTGYPHVQSGKLRMLAITSKDRQPLLPDTPTIAESGIPGYEAGSWFSVALGSDVPEAIVDKISADVRKVMSTPEMQIKLQDMGITLIANTPDEARSMFVSETEKWGKVIESSEIRLD